MLTMYTAVNKDFLALDSKIDRGGILSWETDESWASIPKKGARCGIAIMNGTRESAILKSGIREIVTLTNREPRWPLTRIYEEIDPLSHEKRQVRKLLSIQEAVGPLNDTLQ